MNLHYSQTEFGKNAVSNLVLLPYEFTLLSNNWIKHECRIDGFTTL